MYLPFWQVTLRKANKNAKFLHTPKNCYPPRQEVSSNFQPWDNMVEVKEYTEFNRQYLNDEQSAMPPNFSSSCMISSLLWNSTVLWNGKEKIPGDLLDEKAACIGNKMYRKDFKNQQKQIMIGKGTWKASFSSKCDNPEG